MTHNHGQKLRGDIERKYDQLFKQIEAETDHGVEHHNIYRTVPLDSKEHEFSHPYYMEERPAHELSHPYYIDESHGYKG